MGLDATSVVDAIGFEDDSGMIVLSILDSWDWTDVQRHLLSLQEKLNAYFAFIESGQILEEYPQARGSRIRIDVIGRFPLPSEGSLLLDHAKAVGLELDLIIAHKIA